MTFANPHYLWLLLAIPPAMIVFFWWSERLRQDLMAQFIHARLLPGLIAGVSTARQKIRAACLVLAVIALLLTLAQPRWGYDLEEVRQRGLDIVVAIDTSKSMLAKDIAPNRLERAKLAALDLMQQAKSDRLGLVAFAGTAFLQCPLTFDDAAFRQSLQALDVNTISGGGTALAPAIEEGLKAFKEGDNYKVLVLFTDGEDHDSGALEAAKKAAASGLSIFTIGIGSVEGDLLHIADANGQSDYIRDENGNVVKSHLNEPLLQQIAGAADGFYLPLRGARAIDTLYQKGLAPLPKSESKEKWVRHPHERYHWPLTAAIVLLVLEMLLPERKYPKKVQRSGQSQVRSSGVSRSGRPEGGTPNVDPAVVITAMALLLLPVEASGSPARALREYKSGNYGEALKDYERALEKKGDDPRLHFNAGAAAYRQQQFDQATKYFGQAIASPDLKLQEQAYYNLGNALYRQGERSPDPAAKSSNWEESLKKFESSLKLNSQDADAKFNYEFVKKKLEELKKQQQQQQKQENQDRNQNQNQNQERNQNQNQQDQQSQKDQQQKSQSQSQQQEQQQQKHENQNQNQSQNQPEPQPAQKSPNPEKDQPQPKQNPKQAQANAVGEMTPREAQQLLDSQKNDELMLPVSRKQTASDQQRPIKDW